MWKRVAYLRATSDRTASRVRAGALARVTPPPPPAPAAPARTSARSPPCRPTAPPRRSASPSPHSTTSEPMRAPGTGVRSTVIMSMDTRPAVTVRTPSTRTGVPLGAWRGIAVRVAAGHDADAHRVRGVERGAVAHVVAGSKLLDGDEPRAQRHRRHEAQARRAAIGERRRPVERDAPRTVSACVRGCAKIAAELARLRGSSMPCGRRLEAVHRLVHALGAVGGREVGHEGDRLRRRPWPAGARARAFAAAGAKPSRFMPVLILR